MEAVPDKGTVLSLRPRAFAAWGHIALHQDTVHGSSDQGQQTALELLEIDLSAWRGG